MKIIEQINFEELNDDILETAYYLQEENCKKSLEEMRKNLSGDLIKQLNNLYDRLCEMRNLSNMIFFKLGMKKAANVFIDGL